jgi:hypothetical protein
LGPRGNKQAIKPTLMNDRMPRDQKIVGSSALTKSRPTMDVDVVFETC